MHNQGSSNDKRRWRRHGELPLWPHWQGHESNVSARGKGGASAAKQITDARDPGHEEDDYLEQGKYACIFRCAPTQLKTGRFHLWAIPPHGQINV